ncbi:alpha/beta fold hydrolase [Halomonas sp. M20]|uniref:alpha/beta fold hydrolase n=1 Tax=Halomonas sp. M20 TaxID=2763264 RepID=UPI001D0BADA1|nr:alpha/beta fold hydrolase [Halomonas sp. M20]
MTSLVLLSGWGIDARIWQPLAPHWPAGVAVTAPDWPGYGVHFPLAEPQNLEALAASMVAHLPREAIWVGWSLGALLAVSLLDYLPSPKAVIMLGMGRRFCSSQGVTLQSLRAFRRAYKRDGQSAWQRFLGWQLEGEPDSTHCRQALTRLIGADTTTLPSADDGTLMAGLEWLERLDVSRQVTAPPCPIVTLAGAHDPFLDATTRREATACLPGAGHCPQLSRPEALTEALVSLAHREVMP